MYATAGDRRVAADFDCAVRKRVSDNHHGKIGRQICGQPDVDVLGRNLFGTDIANELNAPLAGPLVARHGLNARVHRLCYGSQKVPGSMIRCVQPSPAFVNFQRDLRACLKSCCIFDMMINIIGVVCDMNDVCRADSSPVCLLSAALRMKNGAV